MLGFEALSLDQIVLALMATLAMRELLVAVLPDAVAGPNGWLVRTDDER